MRVLDELHNMGEAVFVVDTSRTDAELIAHDIVLATAMNAMWDARRQIKRELDRRQHEEFMRACGQQPLPL